MSHESKYTIDHNEIQQWVKARGGHPATIEGTAHRGEQGGLLRIDFPGGATDPPLKPISWDAFFEKFEQANLGMVYQDEKADGSPSYFCKLISRDTAESSK